MDYKNKKRILIVDDDSAIGEMLKTLLEFYGYEVKVTSRPEETESLITNENIDMVILDVLISGVYGTDVCARLRKNESTANIPILMMSALQDAGNKCIKAGANDFIAKPFEMEDLKAKIDQVLSKKKINVAVNLN